MSLHRPHQPLRRLLMGGPFLEPRLTPPPHCPWPACPGVRCPGRAGQAHAPLPYSPGGSPGVCVLLVSPSASPQHWGSWLRGLGGGEDPGEKKEAALGPCKPQHSGRPLAWAPRQMSRLWCGRRAWAAPAGLALCGLGCPLTHCTPAQTLNQGPVSNREPYRTPVPSAPHGRAGAARGHLPGCGLRQPFLLEL